LKAFEPQLIYIDPGALDYPLGVELKEKFEKMGLEIRKTTSHNQVRNIPGKNENQKYRNAKSTLVIGVRKTLKFDTSKPSADCASQRNIIMLITCLMQSIMDELDFDLALTVLM
jgi:spore photoproduct lyase